MTKPVINPANNSGTSKASSTLYEHSINTNNVLPKYQQPNHYGFVPAMHHNKSNRLEYQQDSQELRIATIAALSQQIKRESRNGLYGNSTGKRDLYERGHVAACSRGQAVALTVFIFSSIFFTSLAIAFVRPFTLEEAFGKISPSYLDHCDTEIHTDSDTIGAHKTIGEHDESKYFSEGIPLATSCNDKPCEFEEEFPWNDVRLPSFIQPIRYDIELTPNLTTLGVKGIVKLIFKVSRPTYYIVFHSRNISITSRTINARLKVVNMLEFTPREQVYLETDEMMTPEIPYSIRLKFEYKLSNHLAGFYLSKYKDKNGKEKKLATSHFEPTYARRAFPCFDEPHLKAKFLMTITHDRDLVAFFNTPKKGVSSNVRGKPNQIRDEFEETVEMSTYLVAFVVCDFAKISDVSQNKVNVSVIASKEKINQAEFALISATKLMDYYADFFGIPYPLPKQDLIAIPDFGAGAMENWGLITYRETSLLYSQDETSVQAKQWIGVVVAHELAHQWFGNLVTMLWWNDLWLNEGFASFMEYRGVDHIQPDWKMRDQFFVDVVNPALELDSLTTSHPVSVEVKDPKEIEAIFDAISYKKGASIIHMLESTVGEEVLRKGLSKYLKAHKFGNAVTNDLWQAIQEAWDDYKEAKLSNQSKPVTKNGTKSISDAYPTISEKVIDMDFTVKEMMDTWTLQTGYPIVTFNQQNDTNIYTIDQQRFLSAYKLNNSLINKRIGIEDGHKRYEDYKWIIPFSYESNLEDFKENFVLNRTHSLEIEFPADMTWFKANVNGSGFYRVNYPRENWDALIQKLIEDHNTFSALDRAQLISDAFALSRAGLLEATVPLEMLLYLPRERDYAPWCAAVMQLKHWRKIFQDTSVIRGIDSLIQHLITKLYNELGWNDTGNHKVRLLRQVILSLAVNTHMDEAEKKAQHLYQDFKTNGHKVPPDFRSFVYCTGIRLGNEEDWNFAFKMYNDTIIASERSLWMRALTASPDAYILEQFLHSAIKTDKIRSQDVRSVFAGVSANPAGFQMAWRQLQMYWPTLMAKFGEGSFTIGSIIQTTISHFSTDFDYKAVQRFFRGKRKDVGSGLRNLDQAIEQILINKEWKKENEKAIKDWIDNKILEPHDKIMDTNPLIYQV